MSIGVDTEKELNAVDFLEAAKEDPKAQNLADMSLSSELVTQRWMRTYGGQN